MIITSKKRPVQEILEDYRILNESIAFIDEGIDELCKKYDLLEDQNAPEENLVATCNQINYLYKKLQSESLFLEKLAAELKLHGYNL